MIEATDGEPTKGLQRSVYAHLLPKASLAFAFRRKVPEQAISYEDAAGVILSNLDQNGRFSRRRVGVALPVGRRNFKATPPDHCGIAPEPRAPAILGHEIAGLRDCGT
jgi:hypothetical protein